MGIFKKRKTMKFEGEMNHSNKVIGLYILLIGILIAVLGASDLFSFLIIDIIINNFFKTSINFNTLDNYIRISSLVIGFSIALLGIYIHKKKD